MSPRPGAGQPYIEARVRRRRMIILDACADERQTSATLAELIGCAKDTAQREAALMVTEGLLTSTRGGKQGGYDTTMAGAKYLADRRKHE